MKKILFLTVIAAAVAAGFTVRAAGNAATPTNSAPTEAELNYTKSLDARVSDIVRALSLTESEKATRVHDALIAQYRALNTNDAALRASPKDTNVIAQVHAARKTLHDEFLAKLSKDLTPQQIETVKDRMTYNKVKVTYDAYCEIIPGLTDAQKTHILQMLKDAREEAMDGGSSEEKSAIFKKYKGRIANYLSKEGVDEQKARKEWGEKQKAKAAATKTNAVPAE